MFRTSVSGFEIRISDFGSLGFEISGFCVSGVWVPGSRIIVLVFVFRVRFSGFGAGVKRQGFGFRVLGFGFRVQSFGFRVSLFFWGFGFRVSDPGFGFTGSSITRYVTVAP